MPRLEGQQNLESEREESLSPEEAEEHEKLRLGASNVIKCFSLNRSADNKKGENLLIVTDSGVDRLMMESLLEAGREAAGDDCRVIVASKTEHAAQEFGPAIGEKMKTADAILLLTSLSRSHSKESREVYHPPHNAQLVETLLDSPLLRDAFPTLRRYPREETMKKLSERRLTASSEFPSKARLISITNTNRETLTQGGAQENPIEMAERIERFARIMDGIEKVKVVSANGTNLELDLKVPTRMKETGIVDKPGIVANFPSGEYGYSVDLVGTNGVYVVDGAVGMIGRVDQPIKIILKDGVAIKIEGGEAAQKLKDYLQKAEDEYKQKYPEDTKANAFKAGEFSFGMNSKAFRYTPEGKKISPPTSLEGEKGLGTVHLALGKNAVFNIPETDPDYNNVSIHIDCVAMEPSVAGIKKDGTKIELLRNGDIVCL